MQRGCEELTTLHSFHEGMRVRVIAGPLRNYCGHLGSGRLVKHTRAGWHVEFDCLPACVSVIMPGWWLELVYLYC